MLSSSFALTDTRESEPPSHPIHTVQIWAHPSCVFYGDLYGCGGDNPQEPVNQLEDIIRARKLFAYGELVDYWDHPNCLAWLRKGDEEHDPSVTVICNGKGDGEKRVEVGKDHAGEKWTDLLGWTQGEVTIGDGACCFLMIEDIVLMADGWADFSCPPESLAIWTKTDARGREEFKKD